MKHDDAIKAEAIRRVAANEKQTAVAADLGVAVSTVRTWWIYRPRDESAIDWFLYRKEAA